jgi:hypothetical protein
MVIEPAVTQHPSVQKLGLNVRKLEEATMEMMTPWFNEQGHPENAAKKPFFKEIFKVAKAEERYKNGEIGKLRWFGCFQIPTRFNIWQMQRLVYT